MLFVDVGIKLGPCRVHEANVLIALVGVAADYGLCPVAI